MRLWIIIGLILGMVAMVSVGSAYEFGEPFRLEMKDDGIHGLDVVNMTDGCLIIEPYAKDITKFEYDKNIPIKVDDKTYGLVKIPGILSPLVDVPLCFDDMELHKIEFGFSTTEILFANGDAVEDNYVCALSNNTLVVSWCDETLNDINLKIYYTNGTNITTKITADDSIDACPQRQGVSCTAFNSTHFVIGWFDDNQDDISFKLFNLGNNITDIIDADDNVSTPCAASVSAFNSTHFVIGWNDNSESQASFKLYDLDNNITDIIDANDAASVIKRPVSVSTFNSTHFVFVFYDNYYTDISFKIYNLESNITGVIDANTACGAANGVSVTTLNTTYHVIAWTDNSATYDASFRIYELGNALSGAIDADDFSATSYSVTVSSLNMSHFVTSWHDVTDGDASFKIFELTNNITSETDSSISATYPQSVFSRATATNIGFCNQNFVQSWINTTYGGRWAAFQYNGSDWDGNCEEGGAPPFIPACCTEDTVNKRYIVKANGTCSRSFNALEVIGS